MVLMASSSRDISVFERSWASAWDWFWDPRLSYVFFKVVEVFEMFLLFFVFMFARVFFMKYRSLGTYYSDTDT